MTTRELVSDDGAIRRYRVLDDKGQQVGSDEESVPSLEETNGATLRSRASAALSTNAAFVALASPSNAQVVSQVKALSRQNNGLARLVLGDLSGTE